VFVKVHKIHRINNLKICSLAGCQITQHRRPERKQLADKTIQNSLLALILAEDALWPALKLPRVKLQLGPMPSDPEGLATWCFFPVDALITLSSVNPQQSVPTFVGQHGCVLPPQVQVSAMQTRVMVSGQAYRMNWNELRADSKRHAMWLRYTLAATQGLIGQMAQWAFCVQHHTLEQRLASWLLHCIAQSSNAELNVEISNLPLAIRQLLVPLQPGMSQPGIFRHAHDWGVEIQEGCLRTTAPNLLRARACSCHQEMAKPKA
jgi:hypothetical protein